MTEFEKIKKDPSAKVDFNKLFVEIKETNHAWYAEMLKSVLKSEEPDDVIMRAPGIEAAIIFSKVISEIEFPMAALPLVAAALEVNRAHIMAQVPYGADAYNEAVDILSGNTIFISGRKKVKIERNELNDDGK